MTSIIKRTYEEIYGVEKFLLKKKKISSSLKQFYFTRIDEQQYLRNMNISKTIEDF